MGATCADHAKVAVLGARRGDWLCIGTSLDALGAGGASPPPAPTSSDLALASYASPHLVMAPSACELLSTDWEYELQVRATPSLEGHWEGHRNCAGGRVRTSP
jgi:hypothetical protein